MEAAKKEAPINKLFNNVTDLEARSIGCLLGLIIGDILGAPIEGWRRTAIIKKYGQLRDFVSGMHMGMPENEPPRFGQYTDDSTSALALAQSLVTRQGLDGAHIAMQTACFWRDAIPKVFFSSPSAAILQSILDGANWKTTGTSLHTEGSFANGGAMKIAPLGIVFRNASDTDMYKAVVEAVKSTHVHPESIDGAWLVAKSVSMLCKISPCDMTPTEFITKMKGFAKTANMRSTIHKVLFHLSRNTPDERVVNGIMNSLGPEVGDVIESVQNVIMGDYGRHFQIKAVHAVPCALYAVAKCWQNPEECIIKAANFGGDTDTIAAISGAIIGSLHGTSWIPSRWYDNIRNEVRGRDFAVDLAR